MMELWQLAAAVGGLGLMAVCVAGGWWLGYRSHVDEALELYTRTGGFWHRGKHYDVRATEPTYGLAPGPHAFERPLRRKGRLGK